jgi:anti-sigma-K factor RskA
MTHAEMESLYELYVLGALESDLANEIDEHLGDQCAFCLEKLRDAVLVTSAMAGLAESQSPPPQLRDRILASVGGTAKPKTSRNWLFGLATAAALLLAVAAWSLRNLDLVRGELSLMQQERDQLRSVVEILSRPETRTAQFGREVNAPHGRVFLSQTGGLVFVGQNLPKLAADKAFELWYVPAQGAPQPAGLFRPNAEGRSVQVSPAPANGLHAAAIAVSIEPAGGSSAPTTTPILVIPVASSGP